MEVFVEGCVKCLIVLAIIAIVIKGEKNKKEKISQGKIYYGIFRMPILYSLAFMTSVFLFTFVSTILYYLFDITVFYDIPEKSVFLIEITISILLMYSYIGLYKRHYFKLIKKYIDEEDKEDDDTNNDTKNNVLSNIKNIYKTNKKMCLLVIVIFVVIGGILFTFVNLPQDYENIKDSVVMIKVYDEDGEALSIGSGFCVFDSNCIVTNFHVIEGAYKIEIITDDNIRKIVDEVDIINKTKDMAILKGKFNLEPLKIGNTSNLKAGMEVSAIGSPEGEMNTVSTGIISNADNDYQIRITTPISPGSSGGVLLNDKNQVIGVTYATYDSDDAQNLNYAIKIDYFKEMYESIDSGENFLLTKEIDTDRNYRPLDLSGFYRWTNKKQLFYYERLDYFSEWKDMYDNLSKEEQNKVVDYYWLLEDYSTNTNVKNWEEIDYILNLTTLTKAEYAMILNDLSNYTGDMFDRINSYNISAINKIYIGLIIGGMDLRDFVNSDVEMLLDNIWDLTYSSDEIDVILNYLGFTIKGDMVYW